MRFSPDRQKAILRRTFARACVITAAEYVLLVAIIAVGLWALVGGEGGIGRSLQGDVGSVKADLATAAP